MNEAGGIVRPVVTPEAEAWINGTMSAADYFAWAKKAARAHLGRQP